MVIKHELFAMTEGPGRTTVGKDREKNFNTTIVSMGR